MLDDVSPFYDEDGPKMIGPQNINYGRELSQVETRAIDYAAIDYATKLLTDFSQPFPIRVLDLGCGTGYNAERFARMGCEVTAIDLRRSQEDITKRNRRLMQEGFPIIQFINQDIINVDFAALTDQPWNVVFLNRILHFIPESQLKPIMQSIIDVSSPDTHFVINFRSSDHKTLDREGRTFIESDEDGCLPTYYLHNAKKFIAMLERMGCSVTLHEEHEYLCLLFVKNSPAIEPMADLAPNHPTKRGDISVKQFKPEVTAPV